MPKQVSASGLFGIVLGFAVAVGLGATSQPDTLTIEQRLARIERGLFKPDSTLLVDDDRSIEQMLEQIRLDVARGGDEARVIPQHVDRTRLRELDRTVAQLADSLQTLDREKISGLREDFDRFKRNSNGRGSAVDTTRLRDLGRSVADLSRSLQALDRNKVADLRRDLDQLQRDISGDSSVRDVRRSVDRMESSLKDLERRVRSLEQRIR